MRRLAIPCALATSVCLFVPGAPTQAAKHSRTPVTSGIKNLKVPPEELRIRVRALIRPTLGIVEEAADRIVDDATDPTVRRGALHWKIETTTTLLSAMLRNDPVLALADAWGYAIQVRALLAHPDVAAIYGPSAGRASDALDEVERSFREFAAGVQADLDVGAFEASVRDWAEGHPIEGALYRRPSMDSAIAASLAVKGGKGALAALGNLEETTSDVMTRLDLYTMYLPRLARWEAELAVDDMTRGVDPKTVAAEFERFTKAADRIATVAEEAPALVDRERAAALDALRAERVAATNDLRGERRAVIAALRKERIAGLHELEAIAQRLAERSGGPVREAVREDTELLLAEVEAMRRRLVDGTENALIDVVDHAFLRGVELLLIAAALGATGVLLYARFLRR